MFGLFNNILYLQISRSPQSVHPTLCRCLPRTQTWGRTGSSATTSPTHPRCGIPYGLQYTIPGAVYPMAYSTLSQVLYSVYPMAYTVHYPRCGIPYGLHSTQYTISWDFHKIQCRKFRQLYRYEITGNSQ